MQRHLLRAAPVLMALLFGLGLAAAPALASPVAPIDVTIVQPDGTSFQAHPYGDEWTNGYETKDGYTLAREETTGFWEYADHDAAGRLKPSGWRPGKQSPPAVEKHLRDKTRAVNPNAAAASSALKSQMAPNIGSQSVLVILVQFTNQSSVGSSPANWSNAFFGSGASVKRYYEEASYGKFSFVPATTQGTAYPGVVGWLTLPYAHPNTGGNTSDANRQIVHDAIIAADPYVNYAGFDTNHDGYLSYDELHIVVVVAGYEAAYGGTAAACSPNVWAHRWALGDTVPAPQVDGVYAGGYAGGGGYLEFGEWDCATYDYPGHMATIGTAAHELGHDIRWPDLYDVDQSSEGVGVWSIMGSGGWLRTTGYAGSLPGHPDAFSKAYQGWLTPTQISGNQAGVTLSQVETNPQVVQLLDNPNGIDWLFGAQSGTGEYYLAENRQKTGFDAGLPGSGLLIWHIDESVTASNYANANEYHPLVGLEQADGLNQLQLKVNRGDVGDPYPGTSNNYTFNDTSNPNSKLYSGASSGASVTNISTGSSTISADFAGPGGGTTPTPTPTPTATPTAGPSSPIMAINAPSSGSTSTPPFDIAGWAIDRGAASGTGVLAVGVYAISTSSGSITSLGLASYGEARSDVAATYGAQFTNSGFRKTVNAGTLSPGSYIFRAYAYSTVANAWNDHADVTASVGGAAPASNPAMDITSPSPGAEVAQPFDIAGWAIDRGAASGTGVLAVGVYAISTSSGSITSLGLASYGEARSDVAAAYGPQFTNSGFRKTLNAGTLAPGSYILRAYAYSSVANAWNNYKDEVVTVQR